MKTVALEGLMADVIVMWCENLAELGCPRNAEPDMWFREMTDEQRVKVAEKLLDIIERNYLPKKEKKNKLKENCKKCAYMDVVDGEYYKCYCGDCPALSAISKEKDIEEYINAKKPTIKKHRR